MWFRPCERGEFGRWNRELEDRRFRSATLRQAARVLRDLGQLDDEGYAICEVAAVELALGAVPEALETRGAP